MEMVNIKFLEDCTPKNGSGVTYKKDQVIEVREDSARHWIKRRKAVAVNGEVSPPAPPKAPESAFTDKAEAVHEKRDGRNPAAASGHNTAFEQGQDA